MYTYAFLPISNTLDLPEGISGSLQLVTVDQLAALVEPDLSLESLQTSDDVLMRAVLYHDQVIREVFEQTPVLPLRFGTCFVSRQGLMEHLGTHRAEYLEKLEQLSGQAEYLLKLKPIPTPENPISVNLKGREYFLAKKQHYQNQTEWQNRQQAELETLKLFITQHYPNVVQTETTEGIERIYLLSDRVNEAHLKEQAKEWQMRSSYWDVSLGGALPPYHFV
ncbi:gas vesicle protein [filamentous cyanobacterium CCP1]|nr:gas vesicle protein [filamentous cyanobacterium CCP2]PSB64527.1 gas vesicle protein [filamentous cyanobacterium CCP1]